MVNKELVKTEENGSTTKNMKMLGKIAEHFEIGEPIDVNVLGSGNINHTFVVTCPEGNYVLQKINKNVFKKPDQVMENIKGVTRYLKKKILKSGGDPERQTLFPVDTLNGTSYYIDEDGEYWRMYDEIKGAKTYDKLGDISNPEERNNMFYKVGAAFGEFQEQLKDYDVLKLKEAIPNFHNTINRYEDFRQAFDNNKAGRLQEANGPEHELTQAIQYLLDSKKDATFITEGLKNKRLPYRVTHNDTKLNNVMIDEETGEPICVIDLDTVGPDSVLVDFGDAIRSGTNLAGEEPENLEDAKMDFELFRSFTEGFLGKVGTSLTKEEIDGLHKAPRAIALELATRFLGDYLNGDTYFRLKPGQPEDTNFKRALAQINLAKDMARQEEKMAEIVKEIMEKCKKAKNNEDVSDGEIQI